MNNIKVNVLNFLQNPFPLWNCDLATLLVNNVLKKEFGDSEEGHTKYSLSGCLLKDWKYSKLEEVLPIWQCERKFSLVSPTPHLSFFYEKHGLIPLTNEEFQTYNAVNHLDQSISLFCKVPNLLQFVSLIVKSIQLIRAENDETDVSYSNPDIPFTIFVSICKEQSLISTLRLAESILHESMHLLLTLIEGNMALIYPASRAVYYSPWREENRPVRGVLHGLFVFKAVKDFYEYLSLRVIDPTSKSYILNRLNKISSELIVLKDFSRSSGLTKEGQQLAVKLV